MMPPIIWIMIVGVAATALGTGFLMPAIPDFNLQGVSVNERDFSSPITTANVDIAISKVRGVNSIGEPVFKNRITECSFHTPSSGLEAGSTVICKLTDDQGDVVAEGRKDFQGGLSPSSRTFIQIEQIAFQNANEIQNVNDIKIIVLGTDPTCDLDPLTTLPNCQ